MKVVAELMPYSGGLKRNIVRCLDDYDIPLKLSHTVIDIKGKRAGGGSCWQKSMRRTDRFPEPKNYECDTLLLSVGLIPENELSRTDG